MTTPDPHEDEGAVPFDFICSLPSAHGLARNRISFAVKVGDNPDFWRARLLMPGAVKIAEYIAAIIPCESEGEWEQKFRPFLCEVRTKRSVYRFTLFARGHAELITMCLDIGAVRPSGCEPPSLWEKAKCVLRFLWLRRPKLIFRSPVDQPRP